MGKMAAIPDDCERTATVALPTAASGGFISGDVGISAALDAFSTVYELPLTRFKKGQTNKQTNKQTDGRARSLYLALRCASREVKTWLTSTESFAKVVNRQLTHTPECSSSYYSYSFSARLAQKRQQLRRRFQREDTERSAGFCTCTLTNRHRHHIVCKLEKAAFPLTLMYT